MNTKNTSIMRALAHTAILLTTGILLCFSASGAGLKVSPARILVRDVKPGRAYELYREAGVQLTLYNEGAVPRTWKLTVHRPSERGPWEKGYTEIPDASWCRFEVPEVTVPPNDKAHARFWLEIPEGDQYYNQQWIVTLGIGSAPGQGSFSLAADIRVQIETQVREDVPKPPQGPLGIVPAAVHLADVLPGLEQRVEVRVYNNTDRDGTYTLWALPDEVTVADTYLSSGYRHLPRMDWVGYPEALHVAAGESEAVPLVVFIPDDADHYNRQWEAFVLLRSDAGEERFLRLQLDTTASR